MEPDVDPFADGVLEPEEIRGSEPPPEQPFECASCGLAFGDESEIDVPGVRRRSHGAGRADPTQRLTR